MSFYSISAGLFFFTKMNISKSRNFPSDFIFHIWLKYKVILCSRSGKAHVTKSYPSGLFFMTPHELSSVTKINKSSQKTGPS